MPWTYRHASREFASFLADAREEMELVSDNSAYTAVQGVLLCFRRRLTVQQALDFAGLLPSVVRAIFVADWQVAPPLPFADRAALTAEAQALRPHHNLTPDNCIAATALALRHHVDQAALDALLATFPAGAVEFWHLDGPPPTRKMV